MFNKNTSKIVKLLELESGMMVAKSRGREKWGEICQCTKLQLSKMSKSLKSTLRVVPVEDNTELYTEKFAKRVDLILSVYFLFL